MHDNIANRLRKSANWLKTLGMMNDELAQSFDAIVVIFAKDANQPSSYLVTFRHETSTWSVNKGYFRLELFMSTFPLPNYR